MSVITLPPTASIIQSKKARPPHKPNKSHHHPSTPINSLATAARLVTTPAPGPDPSRGDARLAALVHGAFRAFLHWAHERALRLPDRYFAWLVAYLVHWTTIGLYGLPPPPVPDAELVDGLTRLVARFAADARRRAGAEQVC